MRRTPSLAALACSALILSACGASDDSSSAATSDENGLEVMASFYPLKFVTSRIMGGAGSVETLTSPGVDPHDAELTPQSVASVQQADLVIYSSGLQASVDDAVEGQASDHSFDVNPVADLLVAGDDHGESGHEGDDHSEDDAHEEEGHEGDDHSEDDAHDEEGHEGHDHGDEDPHFWLDPERMADVSEAIAEELATLDPDNAQDYRANADELIAELTDLKNEYDTGLANCSVTDMITTHAAFGYIAEPYGLEQISVTGLAPNAEPSPARLAEVSATVEDSQATTIYSEVLLGADIAETIANETGADVALLDPIEGVTDESPGEDYLEIMSANLDVLRQGQGCS
ncbi:MAG: zinc ABC transporter substrate-binding protein [Ornithinimicrobium sp.]